METSDTLSIFKIGLRTFETVQVVAVFQIISNRIGINFAVHDIYSI